MPEQNTTVLGFDYGSHWIGVAVGQSLTGTASPLQPLPVKNAQPDWQSIASLIDNWNPDRLIVGYPLKMNGEETDMTRPAKKFSQRLGGRFHIKTELVDERLTTREAMQIAEGQASKKLSKPQIDSLAAVLITETWLHQR